jgi:hypothetical protein
LHFISQPALKAFMTERFGHFLNLATPLTKSMTERFGHHFVMHCGRTPWQNGRNGQEDNV